MMRQPAVCSRAARSAAEGRPAHRFKSIEPARLVSAGWAPLDTAGLRPAPRTDLTAALLCVTLWLSVKVSASVFENMVAAGDRRSHTADDAAACGLFAAARSAAERRPAHRYK